MATSDEPDRMICTVHGCNVNAREDGLLYRISPKGSDFIGMCPEHYREWIESVR